MTTAMADGTRDGKSGCKRLQLVDNVEFERRRRRYDLVQRYEVDRQENGGTDRQTDHEKNYQQAERLMMVKNFSHISNKVVNDYLVIQNSIR